MSDSLRDAHPALIRFFTSCCRVTCGLNPSQCDCGPGGCGAEKLPYFREALAWIPPGVGSPNPLPIPKVKVTYFPKAFTVSQ